MPTSSIFAANRIWKAPRRGVRRIKAPDTSDSVALIQQALLPVGVISGPLGGKTRTRRFYPWP